MPGALAVAPGGAPTVQASEEGRHGREGVKGFGEALWEAGTFGVAVGGVNASWVSGLPGVPACASPVGCFPWALLEPGGNAFWAVAPAHAPTF